MKHRYLHHPTNTTKNTTIISFKKQILKLLAYKPFYSNNEFNNMPKPQLMVYMTGLYTSPIEKRSDLRNKKLNLTVF